MSFRAFMLAFIWPTMAAGQSAVPDWVQVDTSVHVVTLLLTAAEGEGDSLATIQGHHHGDIQLVVPLGWTVRWDYVNGAQSASHSLVLMAEREKLPLEGGRPALDNAMSRSVVAGLKPGGKDHTEFLADQAGWYWLLCGVPGHALRGEWLALKVDREAVRPAVVSR